MKVATDDAARRQRFVWLGPAESPWPFEATGAAWIQGVILCPTFSVVAFILAPRPLIQAAFPGPGGLVLTILTAGLIGLTAGVLTVRKIGRVVSPTRPIRHHVAVLAGELGAPREREAVTHRRDVPAGLWIEHNPANRTVRRLIPPTFKD